MPNFFQISSNFKRKSDSSLRFFAMLTTSFSSIATWWSYTLPIPLFVALEEHMGSPSDFDMQYALLFSLYSFPNIFLPLFGGYFVDKYGAIPCLLFFQFAIFVGSIFFAVGVAEKSWPLMFVGRMIFGIGGENIQVSSATTTANYFEGKEIALAFGIYLCTGSVGVTLCNIASPEIMDSMSIEFAVWMGVILTGLATVVAFLMFVFDLFLARGLRENVVSRRDERTVKAAASTDNHDIIVAPSSITSSSDNVNCVPTTTDRNSSSQQPESVAFSDIFKMPLVFWVLAFLIFCINAIMQPFGNVAQKIYLERDYFKSQDSTCRLQTYGCQSATNSPQGCLGEWYQPPLPYNVTIDGIYYAQVIDGDIDCSLDIWSTEGACTYEWCRSLDEGIKEAVLTMSYSPIIAAAMSPVLGMMYDKIGFRATLNTVAIMGFAITHMLIGYTSLSPIGLSVSLGFMSTLFQNSIWPSVSLVVKKNLIGLGFGLFNCCQAVALAVMPLLVPAVLEMSDEKYVPNVVLMFAIASFIGIVGGVFWNYLDYRSGFVCNSAGQNTSSARASLVSVDNNGGVDVPEGFKTEQSIRFSMMSRHSMISEDEKVTEVEFKKSISVTR